MLVLSWLAALVLVQSSNAEECMCAPAQPGQPIVLNAQPVDKQNIGDQCLQGIQCDPNHPYRYIDGRCNNAKHVSWGMTGHPIIRLLSPVYSTNQNDPPGTVRVSTQNGALLQSTRVISKEFFTDHDFPDRQQTSLAFMVMSQLLTHDVMNMRLRNPPIDGCCKNGGTARIPRSNWNPACLGIDVPTGDRFYSQFKIVCSQVARAQFASDNNCNLPEIEQISGVTSYLDGSVVYGFTDEIAKNLRSMQDGKLKVAGSKDGRPFLLQGSDSRANSHAQLEVIQVLLVRIHNKLCDELRTMNEKIPAWKNDEKLYQEAKKILTAMLQHTIYSRYSEILFGPECAKAYGLTEPDNQGYSKDYDPELNAGITAEFEHLFRSFHSLVEGKLWLCDDNRNKVGEIDFSDTFQNSALIKEPGKLDEILIGMVTQPMQGFDRFYTISITQEFFKQNNQGKFGSDLAAIDLERGRDCGIPPYIRIATLAGWPVVSSFDQLSDRMDKKMIERLKKAYKTVEDIDPILGAILEFPFGNSMVGRTLHYVMAEQFRRLKSGDSLFHSLDGKGKFTLTQLAAIRKTSLSLLICWGSDGIKHIQKDAYIIPGKEPLIECSKLIEDFRTDLWTNWIEKPN